MESFKVSTDPNFQTSGSHRRLISIRRSMHWCCRWMRRARLQALDRTQPGLPMKKGRGATMTHDYKPQRNNHGCSPHSHANGEV